VLLWFGKCAQGVCVKMGQAQILLRMGRREEAVDEDGAVLGNILGVGIDICRPP